MSDALLLVDRHSMEGTGGGHQQGDENTIDQPHDRGFRSDFETENGLCPQMMSTNWSGIKLERTLMADGELL